MASPGYGIIHLISLTLNEDLLLDDVAQQIPHFIRDLEQKLGRKEAEEITDQLVDEDPTKDKELAHVFVKWVVNGSLRWPEDRERLKQSVQDYLKLRSQDPSFKKLSKFETLQSIEQEVNRRLRPGQYKALQKGEQLKVVPGAKVIHNQGQWTVVEVLDPDAAVQLSSGTKWCTSDRDTAEDYLSDGPLYIIYKAGKKYAQAHLETGQVMNLKDETLEDPEVLEIIKTAVPESGKNVDFVSLYIKATKKRWPEGEEAIKKEPLAAVRYAKEIIGGRWPEGEEAIKKDPYAALKYAEYIIKGRWPEGEEAIKKDPYTASGYAWDVIGGRWPEGEEAIKKEPNTAYKYAVHTIKGRWPEGEEAIKKEPLAAVDYAEHIIKGRWPEGEEAIKKDPYAAKKYNMFLAPG